MSEVMHWLFPLPGNPPFAYYGQEPKCEEGWVASVPHGNSAGKVIWGVWGVGETLRPDREREREPASQFR